MAKTIPYLCGERYKECPICINDDTSVGKADIFGLFPCLIDALLQNNKDPLLITEITRKLTPLALALLQQLRTWPPTETPGGLTTSTTDNTVD